MGKETGLLDPAVKSKLLIGPGGAINLNGSGKKQKDKEIALTRLLTTQKLIADLTCRVNKAKTIKKDVQFRLKNSEFGRKLKALNSQLKRDIADMSDLSSRYQGALEVCEDLGIDVNVKNIKQIGA